MSLALPCDLPSRIPPRVLPNDPLDKGRSRWKQQEGQGTASLSPPALRAAREHHLGAGETQPDPQSGSTGAGGSLGGECGRAGEALLQDTSTFLLFNTAPHGHRSVRSGRAAYRETFLQRKPS